MPLLYAAWDMLLAEALSVILAFATYHLLAHRKRSGWLVYCLASLSMIYLMARKSSWITVTNQTMMTILGFKNYQLFGEPEHRSHRFFEGLSLVVFGASFAFVERFDGATIAEILLWCSVIGKTIFLGRNRTSGWFWQIAQQVTGIVFGLHRGIYMYVAKSVIQLLQGVYGYWKWKQK